MFTEELEPNEDFSLKLVQKNVEESPPWDSERSTVTDDGDSMKVEADTSKNLKTQRIQQQIQHEIEGFKTQYSSLYAKLVNNNNKDKHKDKDLMEKEGKFLPPLFSFFFLKIMSLVLNIEGWYVFI